jgi:hypothetical protein
VTGRGAARLHAEGDAALEGDEGVNRREFLVCGGLIATLAATAGIIGWRSWTVRDRWYRLTGAYGEAGTPPPYPVTWQEGTLASRYLKESAAYGIASPPGIEAAAAIVTSIPICLPGLDRSPGDVL